MPGISNAAAIDTARQICDRMMTFSDVEFKVAMFIWRRSLAFGHESERIGEHHFLGGVWCADTGERVHQGVGVSRATLYRALKSLLARNFIVSSRAHARARVSYALNPAAFAPLGSGPADTIRGVDRHGNGATGAATVDRPVSNTTLPIGERSMPGMKLKRPNMSHQRDITRLTSETSHVSPMRHPLSKIDLGNKDRLIQPSASRVVSGREALDKIVSGVKANQSRIREMKKTKSNADGYWLVWRDAFKEHHPDTPVTGWTKRDAGSMKKAMARVEGVSPSLLIEWAIREWGNIRRDIIRTSRAPEVLVPAYFIACLQTLVAAYAAEQNPQSFTPTGRSRDKLQSELDDAQRALRVMDTELQGARAATKRARQGEQSAVAAKRKLLRGVKTTAKQVGLPEWDDPK